MKQSSTVVITMQHTNAKLVKRLSVDFPEFKFMQGEDFKWSSISQTIYYKNSDDEEFQGLLLHELSHALLGHFSYKLDIDLLKQESGAWDYAATTLAPRYTKPIDEAYLDDCLETYRDWLYKRSLCPSCGSTGLQTKTNTYSCVNCRCLWHVNDARQCNLRRLKIQD